MRLRNKLEQLKKDVTGSCVQPQMFNRTFFTKTEDTYISVNLDDVKAAALLDTGSDLTLIERKFFDEFLKTHEKPRSYMNTWPQTSGITGDSLHLYAGYEIPLTIGGITKAFNCFICDEIATGPAKVLLGKDVFFGFKMDISGNTHTVTVRSEVNGQLKTATVPLSLYADQLNTVEHNSQNSESSSGKVWTKGDKKREKVKCAKRT